MTLTDARPIPPRDWARWWWAYLLHALTGLVASSGMLVAPVHYGDLSIVPFAMLPVLVAVRQALEFARRGDTPGRDLGDHLVGFVVGLFAAPAALAGLARWG